MEFIVEKKKGFKVVGLSADTTRQNAPKEIPKIWEDFTIRVKEISRSLRGMENYGVCFDSDKDEVDFRYIAGKEVSEFENIPEEMVMADIEESKYAVFTHKGKLEGLGKTYLNILDFVNKKGMDKKPFWIEFYDEKWKGDVPESEFEIWIAIE